MIILAIVQDRVRPYETVYTTAHEVHSTSELNRVNIIYKSYGIVWNRSQVLHPTPTLECHTITVRFTRVYTRFYTTNTVSYDRHTTNTVQVRIIHGQVRPDTVSTSVQSTCMIIQHSNTTENTTTCWHLETTEYFDIGSESIKPYDGNHRTFGLFLAGLYFILEKSLILFIVQRSKQINTYLTLLTLIYQNLFEDCSWKKNPAKLSNHDI